MGSTPAIDAFIIQTNDAIPQRAVLIKGAVEATGNPNLSAVSKVQNAPEGSQYLQDDSDPKRRWLRRGPLATDWVQEHYGVTPFVVTRDDVSATPIQDAIDLAEPLATYDNHQVIDIGPGTFPEDWNFPRFINIRGAGIGSRNRVTRITGTVTVSDTGGAQDPDAVSDFRSISGCSFEPVSPDPAFFIRSDESAPGVIIESCRLVRWAGPAAPFIDASLIAGTAAHKPFVWMRRCWTDPQGGTSLVAPAYLMDNADLYQVNCSCGSAAYYIVGSGGSFSYLVSCEILGSFTGQDNAGLEMDHSYLYGQGGRTAVTLESANCYVLFYSASGVRGFDPYDIDDGGLGSYVYASQIENIGGWPDKLYERINPGIFLDYAEGVYPYIPDDENDWDGAYTTHGDVCQALDQVGSRIRDIEGISGTPFVVGSGIEPYDNFSDAMAAAGAVATVDDWSTVLVTSGDYGEGSIVDFPPYVEVVAEVKANRGGKNQSVSFHGGFKAVGKGPRKLSDIRVYSEAADTHKLIEIPAMAAGFEIQLILDRCFLDDQQTSPTVAGRVIDTKEPTEIVDSQIQAAVGNDNGVYPPIWVHGDTNFANMTSTDSTFTMISELTANEIMVLLDGATNRSPFTMWGGYVGGHIKSLASGGVGYADIFLSGISSIASVARSAVDLASAGSNLYAFGPSQLSGGGTYTVEGIGTLAYTSMIFAFSGFSVDPGVTLSSQGAWFGYDPATPGNWASPPIDVISGVDELAERLTKVEPKKATMQDNSLSYALLEVQANSGTSTLVFKDRLPFCVGQDITVDTGGGSEETHEIDTVDYGTRTATIVGTLANTHAIDVQCDGVKTAITTSVQNTWYPVVTLGVCDGFGGGWTFTKDGSNGDYLTVPADGDYRLSLTGHIEGAVNAEFEIALFVNSRAIPENLILLRKIGAGGDVGSTSDNNIIHFDSGDLLRLKARRTSATGVSLTPVLIRLVAASSSLD
jgi:hypothetical protein